MSNNNLQGLLQKKIELETELRPVTEKLNELAEKRRKLYKALRSVELDITLENNKKYSPVQIDEWTCACRVLHKCGSRLVSYKKGVPLEAGYWYRYKCRHCGNYFCFRCGRVYGNDESDDTSTEELHFVCFYCKNRFNDEIEHR